MPSFSRYVLSSTACLGLLTMALSSNAYGQDSNSQEADELSAVFACRDKSDSMERLACYDAAVGKFEQAQNSGDLITVSKSQIEQVEKDSFGFSIPSLPNLGKIFGSGNKPKSNDLTEPVTENSVQSAAAAERPMEKVKETVERSSVDEIAINIRTVQEFGYKKNRFFLENGQVWEQTGTKRIRIPKASKSEPNVANIRKASLGSFLLQINGSGAAVGVKRVR